MRLTLSLLWLSVSLCWGTQSPVADKMLADLPVTFERNQGQWPHDVEFASHIRGHLYTFTRTDVIVDGTVHLELIAFSHGKLEALDPVDTKTNYLNGGDSRKWITGVTNYGRLRRRLVFPGVDVVLYGSHGQLEFDYIVAPGATPDAIHFRVRGASVESASGNLKLTTQSGQVLDLHAPIAYQDTATGRKKVNCRYHVNNRGEAAFTTSPFNPALPLLIDPVLTFLGLANGVWDNWNGASTASIVTDSQGSFYLSGTAMHSYDVPTTPGTLRSTSPCPYSLPTSITQCGEAWVMKLNPRQNAVVWATFLGVPPSTFALPIALDPSGNVVVGGFTASPDFPVTPDAYLPTIPPDGIYYGAGFLSKLNATGSALVYSTFLEHRPYVMTMDSHGAVYFLKSLFSTTWPGLTIARYLSS